MIKKHVPTEFSRFVHHVREEESVREDASIKSRYDYGTELLNYTAALMYLEERVNEVAMALKADDTKKPPKVAYVKIGKGSRIGYEDEFNKLTEKGNANAADHRPGECLKEVETIGKPDPSRIREASKEAGLPWGFDVGISTWHEAYRCKN